MKKHVLKVFDLPSSGCTAVLLILSAAFLIGAVAGCVFAERVGGNGETALEEFLEAFLSVANTGELTQPSVLSVIWENLRWPLLILLLSVTPLGLLALPVLFLVRSFLLSFSIASFFRVLGTSGLALAFVLFGVTGLLYVPVLFVLGVQGYLLSGAVTGRLIGEGRKRPLLDHCVLVRCGVCAVVLCVCCFLEYHLIPVLMELLAALTVR